MGFKFIWRTLCRVHIKTQKTLLMSCSDYTFKQAQTLTRDVEQAVVRRRDHSYTQLARSRTQTETKYRLNCL